ncbi:MAG: BREX-1 system phosphatase PglZ type A, partial [Chloroflexota bacterium]|nr:BREX-1 system phosphatase PglZ type A [Chloroflexota bacterium]
MDKIQHALQSLLDRHRIVFWYDAKKELRHEYEALTLPDVHKIELDNNEFGVKHRILREEPNQKFLLYHEGPQPDVLDNWLLDVLLAHGEFKADQVSIWLSELGLGPEFWDVVQDHLAFFKAQSRRTELKKKLNPEVETTETVRMKMLAVCASPSTEPRLDTILEKLLDELAQGSDDSFRTITRSGLDDFLWGKLEHDFGYKSDKPSRRDFAIELFKSCYALALGEEALLSNQALVFLNRWKDSRKHYQAFEELSGQYADILSIEQDLQSRDFRALARLDLFELIEQKILNELVNQLVKRTISATECQKFIWRRSSTYWFETYQHVYNAIDYASQFFAVLKETSFNIRSLSDGIEKYTQTWYQLDQLYRKYIYHLRASRQITLLQDLSEQVENRYTNNYLLKLNDTWQHLIDTSQQWQIEPITAQKDFFSHYVAGFRRKNIKVAVLISDGLRFEIGAELQKHIEREGRYTAELESMAASLPSFTQLGMAALLP